jgi:hypothetical protein
MPLSDLQRRCATVILQLPEAAGFALAGGAALLVHEVTDRGTNDIDCFGPSVEAVDALAPAAIEALRAAGLDVDVVVMASGFAKLVVVDGTERTQVDLGFDPATNAAVDRADEFPSLSDDAYARLLATFSAWDTELRSGAAGS